MEMLTFKVICVNLKCMESSSLRELTLELIGRYKAFSFGNATCRIPYFNNKFKGNRAALGVEVGKGSPNDIFDEVKQRIIKYKIDKDSFTNESLKKFLVDYDIGIDCSGFAYHVLNEEGKSRGLKDIEEYLSFPLSGGLLGKLRARFRPVENTNVKTFAHNENSRVIELRDIRPGDIIIMVQNEEGTVRDHIVVIERVEYEDLIPKNIYYVHSVAWPTDGEYGHGYHEGKIEILDISGKIVDQKWTEQGKTGEENYTLSRAKKSITEVRRLNWFN
jgi:hypothetical protein